VLFLVPGGALNCYFSKLRAVPVYELATARVTSRQDPDPPRL